MKNEFGSDKWVDKFATGVVVGIFAIGGLLSLGFVGVVIWGIVRLVEHFTGG